MDCLLAGAVSPLKELFVLQDWDLTLHTIQESSAKDDSTRTTTTNMISNGGSLMNNVLQGVIDKLNFPTAKHLHLCRVEWINDEAIPMNKGCLFTFRIRIYEN